MTLSVFRSVAGPLLLVGLGLTLLMLPSSAPSAWGKDRLKLATTTSTENSGLLAYLAPHWEKALGCPVHVIPVGTGHALALGAAGDVDVVMVHAPELEEEFVRNGFGVGRRTFMESRFVVVGPEDDPARVAAAESAADAFARIARAKATFVSRGDASGTHHREREVWKAAGVEPAGDWYLEAGQGMGAVLTMANEKLAYTLTDAGTWLFRAADCSSLAVLLRSDPLFHNPYSVIAVNPERFPGVRHDLATSLIDWLCSGEGQRLIGTYTVNGQRLFTPTVVPPAED